MLEKLPQDTPVFDEIYVDVARNLVVSGATDVEIAEALNISVTKLRQWKSAYATFRQAFVLDDAADDAVERALYIRATGSNIEVAKTCVTPGGRRYLVKRRRRQRPDPRAQQLWLRQRRPKQWGDKKDQVAQNLTIVIDDKDAKA
jgi:hypothetical protein